MQISVFSGQFAHMALQKLRTNGIWVRTCRRQHSNSESLYAKKIHETKHALCIRLPPLPLLVWPPQITTFPTLPLKHLRSPSDEHGGAGSCAGIEQRLEPATQDRGVGQRLREGDGAQPRKARTRFADSFGCRVRCSNRSGFLMLRVWVPLRCWVSIRFFFSLFFFLR